MQEHNDSKGCEAMDEDVIRNTTDMNDYNNGGRVDTGSWYGRQV